MEDGFADAIVSAPFDRQNQVWLMLQGKNRIIVQKSQTAASPTCSSTPRSA